MTLLLVLKALLKGLRTIRNDEVNQRFNDKLQSLRYDLYIGHIKHEESEENESERSLSAPEQAADVDD